MDCSQKEHRMPRPPTAEHQLIDLEHLRRMTLGDSALEREVLAMFLKQLEQVLGALAALPPDAGALAHTLKGSARAIGAFGVADHARALEDAIREGGDTAHPLAALGAAAGEARTAIEAVLNRL
jgi:HPt (histidine-containing phosphotransfer) domain-containing protein